VEDARLVAALGEQEVALMQPQKRVRIGPHEWRSEVELQHRPDRVFDRLRQLIAQDREGFRTRALHVEPL
jgi:hypothetical protein